MAGGMIILPDATAYNEVDENGNPKDVSIPTNPLFLYVLTGCSTIGGFLFGYDTVSCFDIENYEWKLT